jgi:hypothetical protein
MWHAAYDNQHVMHAARDNQPTRPGAMTPPQRPTMSPFQPAEMPPPERPAMPAHEYLEYLEYAEMWHAA